MLLFPQTPFNNVMGCPKKDLRCALLLARAQNAANSFNFQICQVEQDRVDNKDDPYNEI